MNDLSHELGAALGIAVLGSIMTSGYQDNLHLVRLPPAVVEQAKSSLGMAMHIGGPVALQGQGAFVNGMQTALLWAAGLLVLTALAVAALLTNKTTRNRQDTIEPETRS
jgi:preprotein translocase subunit SecG